MVSGIKSVFKRKLILYEFVDGRRTKKNHQKHNALVLAGLHTLFVLLLPLQEVIKGLACFCVLPCIFLDICLYWYFWLVPSYCYIHHVDPVLSKCTFSSPIL